MGRVDGNGLRTARAGSWLNWKYVWDVGAGLPGVLKETDSHNALPGHETHGTNNTYVYGLDLFSVMDVSGARTFFLYDGLGSTTNLTDGAGNVTATYAYDPLGATMSQTGTGAAKNEFRFTGEQRDPQTSRNFYYLRARYYDPEIGRFLTPDPLPGFAPNPQTLNRYAYALNNPVNRVDVRGLASESAFPYTVDCLGLAISVAVMFAVGLGLVSGFQGFLLLGGAFLASFALDASQFDYPGVTLDVTDYAISQNLLELTPGVAFKLLATSLIYSSYSCFKDSPEFQ